MDEQPDNNKLPYIEVIQNTDRYYRARHHPSGIEMYITIHDWTKQSTDKPYQVSLWRGEWLSQYNTYHETMESAVSFMFEALNELLME